jgi:DNA-directed RNA polymerase subunit RPC12/RpoP
MIDYICLACGTQGSIYTEAGDGDPGEDGGIPPRCPRCKGPVLYLERKAALI